MIYVVLALVSLITATISGIIGMGGGMLLLAVLFSFLPYQEAIPTHAAVQLCSNTTRLLVFLREVDWKTVGRFSLGAVLGGMVGLLMIWKVGQLDESEPYLKSAVGVYILGSLWFSLRKRTRSDSTAVQELNSSNSGGWEFTLLGLFAGAAAFTLGAVGPLIAPLFSIRDFEKERLIATKAVCQSLLHVVKVPAFLFVLEVPVGRLSTLTLVMISTAIVGTLLGKRLLGMITQETFMRLYRGCLLVAGLKVFLVDGLWGMWNG